MKPSSDDTMDHPPHIHPLSDIRSPFIGARTRIWQYVVVMNNAKVGSDCNICAHCLIESGAVIGDRVTIKCGVQIWDGVTLEDDVFVGPNVTFTNDPFPRSRQHPETYQKTIVRAGASIGANATILPGLQIGRNAMIAAGAVVTRSVPAYAIVKGNPGRITGYVPADAGGIAPSSAGVPRLSVSGASLVRFTTASDLRGDLMAVDLEQQVPFPVKRLFFISNVPSHHVRGEHSHKACHQLLVCLQGSVSVSVDDGRQREQFILDTPSVGLHVQPKIWAAQYQYTENAVLAVFASHPYDPEDYIRDYESFLTLVKGRAENE